MTGKTHKRTRKLIEPGIQFRLAGSFVGLAAVALLLQFLFLGSRMTKALTELEGPGGQLAQEFPGALVQVFVFSMGLLLPVIFGLGIVVTFRIAGPIHRFHLFLEAVARGEESRPCKIRQGDQLQDLCDVINRATESTRQRIAAEAEARTDSPETEESPALRRSA